MNGSLLKISWLNEQTQAYITDYLSVDDDLMISSTITSNNYKFAISKQLVSNIIFNLESAMQDIWKAAHCVGIVNVINLKLRPSNSMMRGSFEIIVDSTSRS